MQHIFLKFSILLISLCFITPIAAEASAERPATYREAFKVMSGKQKYLARHFSIAGPNVILNKVLRAELMALPGNDYSFDELGTFITENPNWPGRKGVIMIAEQKIPSHYSSKQVINWFTTSPPMSLNGLKRYVLELKKVGKLQVAADHVRDWWINRDFSKGEYRGYYKRFKSNLRHIDHKNRISRLIWQKKFKDARKMYRFLNTETKKLMMARIALAKNLRGANKYLKQVPKKLLNDEGLIYERLRWRQKRKMNSGAKELLLSQPANITQPKKWWSQRHIIVRRLMERRRFSEAYRYASTHGMKADAGFPYLQSEFVSGFLSLRKLNKPKQALQHFSNLTYTAQTPVSRARGHYWVGRALEVLGKKKAARKSYESAGILNTTYYGQLALARLNNHPIIYARPESTLPRSIRNKFYKHDMTQAIMQLDSIGQERRAQKFYMSAVKGSFRRADFALLLELAYNRHRPDWAVKAAKAANKKNLIISGSAFPVLAMRIPSPPELALTHALIRQESEFRSKAGSRVGAQGLMQLMPSTARAMAKKLGVRYRRSALADPSYNVLLGTAFIQRQINNFDGSYILALAGYNAGPSRARKWIKMFGDPRSSKIDAIDWIEQIPIYETRNYIMRIMENLQFYRARLNKGKAPLLISTDIKR